MIAKWFRFKNDNENRIGLAVAATKKDLFWEIDQYGDPYACDVINIQYGSMLIEVKAEFNEEKDTDTEYGDLEISESSPMPEIDEDKWKRGDVYFKDLIHAKRYPS